MGVQNALLAAGAAVAGAGAAIKKKGTIGQKKGEGEKEAARASIKPLNILQSQSASEIAAEKAKKSLAEHRKAKHRSKNAIKNFKEARKKRMGVKA